MQSAPLYNDMTPALRRVLFKIPDPSGYKPIRRNQYAPRILLLSDSVNEWSCSRQVIDEVARLLIRFGAETRVFDPRNLPPVSRTNVDHPKVQELRALSLWSEGQVWCDPEMQGAMTSAFKKQIDWLPLEHNIECPSQSRTVAVMQVTSGSERFGAASMLPVLGRWIFGLTNPSRSNVPITCNWSDLDCLVLREPLYDRLVNITEELIRFTLLMRNRARYLLDGYSERAAVDNLPKTT